MKTKLSIFAVVISCLLLTLTISCKKEAPKVIPTLSTTAATNITSTTATSGGTISFDGNSPVTSRGVCWGTNQSPTIADSKTSDGTGIGTFVSSITGLSPGGTYYTRAYATNAVGTAYGPQITITTTSVLPVLITSDLLGISSTTATGGGNVTSDGGAAVVSRGVCWSKNPLPTANRVDSMTVNGMGTGIFSSSITGLTPGATYYLRAYATNSIGTGYGNQLSFTTSAIIPTLTTTAITDIGATSATSGGNITSDGGSTVTSRGVCWGLNQTPTIANSKTVETSGLSIFTSSIIGLNPSTTYYVRAYATNSAGTAYGGEVSFKTAVLTVTDIDGNVYNTVTIGTQIWMAENLKTTKYRNGNLIGTTTLATLDISNATTYPTPKYQWAYAGNESNVATYGRLYTWLAASDSRNVCPTGWHLPTDTEWTILTTFLGGESVAGDKLKEAGTSHWISPNAGATNTSGFTALPGGYRSSIGPFYDIGSHGYWWSSTEDTTHPALYWTMYHDYSIVSSSNIFTMHGFSVRCVKD